MLVNVWSFSSGALRFLWYCAIPVSFVMLNRPQYNFTCINTCDYLGDKGDKYHHAKDSRSTAIRRIIPLPLCASLCQYSCGTNLTLELF